MLSSDSVGPEDYCALAYQDSEVDVDQTNNGAYAAQRKMPARRKSPHRKMFIESSDGGNSDCIIGDDSRDF